MWAAILYGAEQMCVFKLASSINAAQDKLMLPLKREEVQTFKKRKKKEKKRKIQLLHIEQLPD